MTTENNPPKLMAMIHSKESTSAIVDGYSHISLYKNGKEISRFYINDLLFISDLINHHVKLVEDRANQLSDALYPIEFGI